VAGHEFPGADKAAGLEWYDLNWLQIQGTVRSGSRSWTFRSPSLLTTEARSLADWLEEASRGQIEPVRSDELDRSWDVGALTFLEPSLAFSVQEREEPSVVIRIHLAHEAADPALAEDDRLVQPPPFIRIRAPNDALSRAAHEWRTELRAWPVRVPHR
jgi:hypothetical protein